MNDTQNYGKRKRKMCMEWLPQCKLTLFIYSKSYANQKERNYMMI